MLVGNLTRDPELRHTAAGNPVCGLRIAVNGREKKADGAWGDRADYFDVRVWGNTGERCAEFLHKGSKVAVDGRLRHEEWNDSDKGKQSRVLIEARSVQFLDRREGGGHQGGAWIPDETFEVPDADFAVPAGASASADFPPPNVDDDIPF